MTTKHVPKALSNVSWRVQNHSWLRNTDIVGRKLIIQQREEITARAKLLSRQEKVEVNNESPWMGAERIRPLGKKGGHRGRLGCRFADEKNVLVPSHTCLSQ